MLNHAKLAIECLAPTGKTGSFLFIGESHKDPNVELISPVFDDVYLVFQWMRENGWKQKNVGVNSHYIKIEV